MGAAALIGVNAMENKNHYANLVNKAISVFLKLFALMLERV